MTKKEILLIKTERLTISAKSTSPPLGLLYLAAVAEQTGEFSPTIIHTFVEDPRNLRNLLLEKLDKKPALIGLSSLSNQVNVMMDICKFIKENSPKSLLIGGGPAATADPIWILEKIPLDLCVIGEGETVFKLLLEKISGNKDWRDIPGIAYRSNGKVIKNQAPEFIEDMDKLPLIPWKLIDLDKYSRTLNFSGLMHRYSAIMTSRGCPYNCIYCHNIFGKKYRAMSPERVMAEIEPLYNNYKIRRIEFLDDIFNLNKSRSLQILQLIKKYFPQLKISFPNALRIDLLDEELIEALRETGCYHLSVAIESGSERMQKLLKKNIDLEKAKEALKLLEKYRIKVRGYFMIGFPAETEADLEKTVNFALSYKFYERCAFRATAFPATEMTRKLMKDINKEINFKEMDFVFGNYSLAEIDEELLKKACAKIERKNLTSLTFLKDRFLHLYAGRKAANVWKVLFYYLFNYHKFREYILECHSKALEKGYNLCN